MAYRTMTARFPGRCRGCDAGIVPGDIIVHGGRGKTYHVDCNGRTEITTIYFPSTGNTIYRNARGRCEDAPCCGCCTY
jgi:hypothetical protein